MSQTIMIHDLIEAVKDEVIAWRRYLHKYPELSFQEEKTAQFVYEKLQTFGELEISRPTKTSIMARLIGQQPGKVIALRADMDALPIEEENDFDFVSQNSGVMHACGHDGHTAMLLGTAKILTQLKDQIKGEVRFLFQHAEELPPGGAQEMVRAGVLAGVDMIIGSHLLSTLPLGKISLGYGPVMAGADTFNITVVGKGGHASQPELTVDPIAIGTQVVSNLQHIVSRYRDAQEALVISVTQFHAGSAINVIPSKVSIGGSVRSFNPELREEIPNFIERIVKGITEAHGATYEFDYQFGYAPTINDEEVTRLMDETVCEIFGEKSREISKPIMGSEDFSAFQKVVPGSYIGIGARNEEKGIIYPHHHPQFTVDEQALQIGVKLFVHGTLKMLNLTY
ncbi:M20 family metallopeptidase [Peribacillus frigoritolerans]|uniref:M20 family metallopeptidase n=1 Tax=Peribacillus frigoritolerans TaxID=450367 RepID=UPI000BACE97D|nr:M20 family metallopeptidase [Peribacillus frigoritolerans]MED3709204.1 M20 family metallopeptidase [Peribacillus frigoritolerans]MED3888889.1 M20 family metallopeptidase [Peribacillus frigoritolerans]PAW31105.1 N-acyl-L-amino acid amidohydrolase [Peribacillus simplex]ULM98027.1 M20 family metallopeptidase [Peribacillus frigoritolerans]